MRNHNRKNSKHIKSTKRNTRNNDHNRAVHPSLSVSERSERQSPSIDTTKSQVLRIFTGGTAEPELAPRSEVTDSSIVDMLEWTKCAPKIQVQGFAGCCTRAAIPLHEEFKATMHMLGDCMLVEVAHDDHGALFAFGIAPETSGVSQNLWSEFGGEGQQPLGPWCLEVLKPVIEKVFSQAQEAPVWLMEFERALAWMWIVVTRACKGYTVITDPVTGEHRLEDKK